jgi:hypothetical protein
VFSASGAVFTLAWGIAPGVTDKDFLALKARFIHMPLTEESIDSRLQRLHVGREISWGVAPGSNMASALGAKQILRLPSKVTESTKVLRSTSVRLSSLNQHYEMEPGDCRYCDGVVVDLNSRAAIFIVIKPG